MRPPYIYNGFLATLEMADSGVAKNTAVARTSGVAKKSEGSWNSLETRNTGNSRNSEVSWNKTARFIVEPSVQQGRIYCIPVHFNQNLE